MSPPLIRLNSRRVVLAASTAFLATGLGGLAVAQLRSPSQPTNVVAITVDRVDPAQPLEPEPSSSSIRLSAVAANNIANVPALVGAPWLFPGDSSPRITAAAARPSLAFPAGTTYGDALQQLYMSVAQTGSLPPAAKLGPPLREGKVLIRATATTGVIIDLRAPWGFDPDTGAIATPTFSLPGDWTPQRVETAIRAAREAGSVLPEGAFIEAPVLPECEIEGSGSSC